MQYKQIRSTWCSETHFAYKHLPALSNTQLVSFITMSCWVINVLLYGHSVHCTLYTVHCTLYSWPYSSSNCYIHYIVYSVHCTLYTTVYIIKGTLYRATFTLYVHCTMYTIYIACILNSSLYSVMYIIQRTLYSK